MVVQLVFVFVTVVIVVVTVVDLQRGDLAVGLQQSVVIEIEGVGDILVGGNDRGVVLAPARGRGVEVPLEGSGQVGQRGTRVGGHD